MFKDKLTNNKFIVSLLINLTFLFLALLFCDMKYEVSDDFIMDAILSGALGHNYNEHLLFSNILYGYLLKFLYSITEKISWYFVFQVVICFVSLTSLCYIVLKRNNSLIGLIFCLIFVSFFSVLPCVGRFPDTTGLPPDFLTSVLPRQTFSPAFLHFRKFCCT